MVARGAKKMGFLTIGALFEAYIEVKILLNNNDGHRGEKKKRKKRRNDEQEERTGDNNRSEEGEENQQEQARPPRHQRGRVLEVPDPHKQNTHNARIMQTKKDKETWPFSSVVGCEDGKGIEGRNRKVNGAGASLPDETEVSARNPRLLRWILEEQTLIATLIELEPGLAQKEDWLRFDPRLQDLVFESMEHLLLVEAAREKVKKRINTEELARLGELKLGTFEPDILVSRLLRVGSKAGAAELYKKVCRAAYGKQEVTAVEKVRKARCVEGEVTLTRLMRAMTRLNKTPTTNKSYRTAQELILGAVRVSKHLKYNPQIGVERPCSACQLYEDERDYMTGIQHMLQYCGQAVFCRSLATDLILMTFGTKIECNLNELILFEFEAEKVRKIGKENLPVVCGILNLVKSTLFSIYYLRPKIISQEAVIKRMNRELQALKSLAKHRGLRKFDYEKLPLWDVRNSTRTGLRFLIRTAKRDLIAEGARTQGRREEEVDEVDEVDEVEGVVGEEVDVRQQVHGSRRMLTVARRRVAAQQIIHNRGGNLVEDNPIDLVGSAPSS